MFAAIISLALLGFALGYLLGVAAIHLRVKEPEIIQELEALLPGTNCGQCGFPGCPAGARALAEGTAPVTLCPPGGKPLAAALAAKLGVEADLSELDDGPAPVAQVIEALCIGCTRCFKVCPTDAIVGAPKQIHGVVSDACTGCKKCLGICPTMGIKLTRLQPNLATWQWPKPADANSQPESQQAVRDDDVEAARDMMEVAR
ncbi:RnfABCDGE type electron transport complex subunit B [Motiliproteus sp. SC1-56]|uniref:RnfABCDGE type electron transport complex subunit B n=1 Tax=Motiliproteus sp. SC1-56 TaxID=2799565 RepID=UPI001A8EC5BF|nr:RnfABCDGE type electron transport complex subunit B [Motiliproteus sp. SC1-56]